MDSILQKIMGITIVIFMVGNLLEVGLRLHVSEALAALRKKYWYGDAAVRARWGVRLNLVFLWPKK